jgi:hypothetical protein
MESNRVKPQLPDTPLLRVRYRWYRLRVGRNRAACARRTSQVPITEYGMYRQSLWLGRQTRRRKT